jgi:WD40 repeat protein
MKLAFSPDGAVLAAGCDDGSVRVWDPLSGHLRAELLNHHRGTVWGIAFSPDGSQLVSGSVGGNLIMWDAHTWQLPGTPLRVGQASDSVWAVVFTQNGRHLVTDNGNGTLSVWDFTSH